MTDERIFYRTRKTVLEMLRDRGFEIGDDEIEETYEEFEKKYLAKPSMLNFVAKRAVAANQMEVDDGQPASQLMEPIYVKFVKKEEKLSQEQVREIVLFMSSYSMANKQEDMQELQNAILIV